jgi:hypothetical protein
VQPSQATDQAVSVNGRIAAWLTQRLGSMQAFYLAAGTQVIWIVQPGRQAAGQRPGRRHGTAVEPGHPSGSLGSPPV